MPQNALQLYIKPEIPEFTFSVNVVINEFCYISFVCLMTSPLPLSKSKLLCSPLKGVANFCLFSTEAVICTKLTVDIINYSASILYQPKKTFGIVSLMNFLSFHNILFPSLFLMCAICYTILYNFGQCTFSGKSLSVTRVSCK